MKKTIKIFAGIVVGVIAAIFVIAIINDLFNNNIEEKTYSSNGFTITMDGSFYEKDLATSTFYYESFEAGVMGTKEYFKDLKDLGITENSSLKDYGDIISFVNEEEYDYIDLNDKIKYFTYEDSINDKDYFYVSAITKGSDAFWLITLFCEEKNKDQYLPKFEKWLNTVEVE